MKNLFKISLLFLFFIITCLFVSYNASSSPSPPMENIRYEYFEYTNYVPGVGWETNPSYMVNGLSGLVASTTIDGDVEQVYDYFSPGGNYILEVKVRIFAYHYLTPPTPYNIIITPVFGYIPFSDNGEEGDNHIYETLTYNPTGHPFSPWYDITDDTNAPDTWTHNDVYRLAVNVTADLAVGNTLYANQVQVRVKIADYKKYPIVFVNEKYTPSKHLFGEVFFSNISSALEHVMTNGYVIVYQGTYNETVTISRACKIIGQSRNNTIINAQQSSDATGVVKIYTDNVSIKRLNITGCRVGHHGVRIRNNNANVHYCNIWNNNGTGISIQGSSHKCNVSHNYILSNAYEAIEIVDESSNNTVYNNYILNNGLLSSNTGNVFIDLECINNNIRNNNIYPIKYPAVYVNNANYNNITSNIIVSNDSFGSIGININNTEHSNIHNNHITGGLCINVDKNLLNSTISYNNVISNNSGYCLYGDGINNSYIYSNKFLNADYGIYLKNSFNNVYALNELRNNNYGLYIL